MQYIITEEDKLLVQQNNIKCKIRISVLSPNNSILGVLTGVTEIGSFNIDCDSDIRRTSSLSIKLDDFYNDIEAKIESYLNLNFKFEIGILNCRTSDYKYYQVGVFCMTDSNTTYDSSTNTLSLSLSDNFSKLDGTRNGQIGGAPTITIPTEYDGIKNTLKDAMITVLKNETSIVNYIIEDIGEYYGMQQNNDSYLEYRTLNPEWNVLPYDLEFNAGDTISSIVTEIRDLYPNCQTYFDIYDNFCFDMIPSNDKSPIYLDNNFLQSVLVASNSESVKYDISSIKNVVEVFGKTYDVDRYCETVKTSDNIYALTLDSYSDYVNYQLIAFVAPINNSDVMYININEIGMIPIYKEYTSNFIEKDTIIAGEMIVVKIMRDTNLNYVAYYLGQYQPHALCVLTSDINDTTYTKQYFSEKYNCLEKNIAFIESSENPFTLQKLGIIFSSNSGEEYDNIYSNSVALENAKYLIYKSSLLNDTVTLTTKLIPWLDVNVKVSYQKRQDNNINTYLIKQISHDFSNGTTSITMCRFYALYQD